MTIARVFRRYFYMSKVLISERNTKTSKTIKQMMFFSLILFTLAVVFLSVYRIYHQSWMLAAYLTMLTTFYHFAMRLVVGETVTAIFKNRQFNENSFGFRIHSFEHKAYKLLCVKRWKSKVITAKPEQFDLKKITPNEVLHNMLQAELVHRIIIILSFLPLLMIIPYGCPDVFILTSIVASLFDLTFVIIQRYNRPRIMKLVKHYEKSKV